VTLAVPEALRTGVELALADVRAAGRVTGAFELVAGDGDAPVAVRAELGVAEPRA